MKLRSPIHTNEHNRTHEPPREGTLADSGDAIRNTDADQAGAIIKDMWFDVGDALKLSLGSHRLCPCSPAVEHGADKGVAHTKLINQKQRKRCSDTHNQKFRQAGHVPGTDHRLKAHDHRQVHDIKPVRGIGEVTDSRIFTREKIAEETNAP